MSFSIEERNLILDTFNFNESTKENVREKLQPHIFTFLSENGNIGTIVDKCIFRPKNIYRPYESVTLTKFLTDKFDCASAIDELAGNISGNFLIYIDFHFLFLCNPEQEQEMEEFKFQFASKASAINDTHKIVTKQDYRELASEFEGKTYSDLLNDVFVHHVELYEFQNSGLRPYQLLSMVIHLQKFPA